MSELDMLEDIEVLHDIKLRDHSEASRCVWSDLNLLPVLSQITVPDAHALLHRALVQSFVIVRLGHVLGLCFAFIVQKGRVIVRNSLLIFDIAKRVEKLFIVAFGVLQLLRQVVLEVTIGTT